MKYILVMGFILCISSQLNAQFYNGSPLAFGKNRVQYKDFLWTYYSFEKFDTYFYRNGQELAEYTARYAQEHINEIELKLESSLDDKIQFIIFNNLSDLKQSNIGLMQEQQYNTGGITHIIGKKVFLYFDGSHTDFEKQIRAGISSIIFKQMMFGQRLGSQIKNNTLYTMPPWFEDGLISWLSVGWNTDVDSRVRDGILSGRYDKFNHLTGTDAVDAGHSLWKYVADNFGPSAVPNVVHMTKVTRSVENGFLYVVGLSFNSLIQEWKRYYMEKYSADALRYYLLREIPTTDDGDFSHGRFVEVYNSELANGIGNFMNRVLMMVEKYNEGRVPQGTDGVDVLDDLSSLVGHYKDTFEGYDLKKACEAMGEIVNLGNKYIDDKKPWVMAKEGDSITDRGSGRPVPSN